MSSIITNINISLKEKYEILVQLRELEESLFECSNCKFKLLASKLLLLIHSYKVLDKYYNEQYQNYLQCENNKKLINKVYKYWQTYKCISEKYNQYNIETQLPTVYPIALQHKMNIIYYLTLQVFADVTRTNVLIDECLIANSKSLLGFYQDAIEISLYSFLDEFEEMGGDDLCEINHINVPTAYEIEDDIGTVSSLYSEIFTLLKRSCEYFMLDNIAIGKYTEHHFHDKQFKNILKIVIYSVIEDFISLISTVSSNNNAKSKEKHSLKCSELNGMTIYLLDDKKFFLTPEQNRILKYILINDHNYIEHKQDIRNTVSRINKAASKILGDTKLIVSPTKDLPYIINQKVDTFDAY